MFDVCMAEIVVNDMAPLVPHPFSVLARFEDLDSAIKNIVDLKMHMKKILSDEVYEDGVDTERTIDYELLDDEHTVINRIYFIQES